jgi:hypothetical protein
VRIVRFKKYVSWNIVSVVGYLGFVFAVIFGIFFLLTVSNISVKPDMDEYFYSYLFKHVIAPYAQLYKTQLSIVFFFIVASLFEHRHYLIQGKLGLRLFEHYQKTYNQIFVVGLFLNLAPIYIIFMFFIFMVRKFLWNI